MGYGGDNTPREAFGEGRAITVQSYLDVNIKGGVQFEGSTLLTMAGSGVNKTVFRTGSLPVILKGRTITHTGTGVKGEIRKAPTFTGGTSAPYQNPNDINPAVGLSSIIVGATVTDDGVLQFAPTYVFGGTTRQSKGGGGLLGGEKILAPNTDYLLILTSLDTQSQEVSSFLSWFEGEPDIPL